MDQIQMHLKRGESPETDKLLDVALEVQADHPDLTIEIEGFKPKKWRNTIDLLGRSIEMLYVSLAYPAGRFTSSEDDRIKIEILEWNLETGYIKARAIDPRHVQVAS